MAQATIDSAASEMQEALGHLDNELSALQIGRANPALVSDVMIEAYGTTQPLKTVANVSVPDPQTIQIQPYDKGILAGIEKGLSASSLNLNPVNDGVVVRISIPPTTEERRKELVKIVGQKAEDSRVSIRHARQKAHDTIKKMKDDKAIGEDELYTYQDMLQKKVDDFNKQVEDKAKAKEQEIMTV
jgi:ribosome recycling factor